MIKAGPADLRQPPHDLFSSRRPVESGAAWERLADDVGIAVTTFETDSRFGVVSAKAQRSRFRAYRARLAIRLGEPDDAITTLSGGNDDPARWFSR
ncbi:hypothetical protein ABZ260_01930 [Streptosporangium sp. NPDC006013]|uniref:hypothetical protein n=1 Tax=Streptosporangium sp. NPDC006013 TaxID=3155596 RepID=UPI0033ACCC15